MACCWPIAGPFLAGVMLGALIIKPQFGMLAPVCLVASDNWRALAAMATSAILLIALSGAVFGLDTWVGFFSHTQPMLSNVVAYFGTGCLGSEYLQVH